MQSEANYQSSIITELINESLETHFEQSASQAKLLLVSAHAFWTASLAQNVKTFSRPINVTSLVIANAPLLTVLATIKQQQPALILLTELDFLSNHLELAQKIKKVSPHTALVLLCSQFNWPSLEELQQSNIEGILSTSAQSLQELEKIINEILIGQPKDIEHYYSQALKLFTSYPTPNNYLLTYREKKILQLIAADLTNKEVADQLGLSVKSIDATVRFIYAKLGVTGRAGAVGSALSQGLLNSRDILACKKHTTAMPLYDI